MQQVTVERTELLTKVRENRDKHKTDYDSAVETYRVEAKAALREQVKNIDKGEPFSLTFKLPEPREFLDEYDRAIAMLEMSVDDHVKLSEDEFDNLVQDNWPWAHQFAAATSIYNAPHRRR